MKHGVFLVFSLFSYFLPYFARRVHMSDSILETIPKISKVGMEKFEPNKERESQGIEAIPLLQKRVQKIFGMRYKTSSKRMQD